ncbi:hypothetical protein [Streptomyces sp. NBC_01198]|uniref:hypothetical protein n=1 Tax=Streptomyces sp. NBC_01198 TaxID=2903769 RepID=UPI002E0EFB18|nr:hypothetical protein OG702_17255 [Streptomyces sp. NBC_01198]
MSVNPAVPPAVALLLGALALTACGPASSTASATSEAARVSGTDGYAYRHPCSEGQLSVRVTRRAGEPAQRVIAVRNTGTNACGLSLHPRVTLDETASEDMSRIVRPLVPCGLDAASPGTSPDWPPLPCRKGAPPAYPLGAGRIAYAVIDLDPSHGSSLVTRGVDELNLLPDGDHMSDARMLNIPLGKGSPVLRPKLGQYRGTVADAAASMRTAHLRS